MRAGCDNTFAVAGFVLSKIAEAKLRFTFGVRCPIQIRTAIVGGIAAEIDDALKVAKVILEILQVAVDGGRVAHVNLHRVTKVAEFFVDEIHQLMHRLRLAITGHHQTFAGVRLQIFQTFIEPIFVGRLSHSALHRDA